MGRKNETDPLTGEIHPEVIKAAGLDCDSPLRRAWIAKRYKGRLYHPLPVYFAERFDQWAKLPENVKERQLDMEANDTQAGRETWEWVMMGAGILAFRERFAGACAAAATVGDREFFRVFHEVYSGLEKGGFKKGDAPFPFRSVAVRAYDLLVRTAANEGDLPTVARIYEYLEAHQKVLGLSNLGNGDAVKKNIRETLEEALLPFAEDVVGGSR